MSYHLTIPLYRKDLCQSCMGENYTTTTLSPTRIYYLSLVDPTSCFSQRYFLYIVRKFIVIPLHRQERKLQLFISLINYTLSTFAQRHLLYTGYIGNLYQPLVLWLNSSGTLLSIPNAIGCLAHITTLCS